MAVDMKQMRRLARLPAGLRQLTDQGFARINSKKRSAAGPSLVSLRERVEHYAEHAELDDKALRPELKKNLSRREVTGLASQIDSGLTLLEIGKSSDPLVKPVLFYYGVAQVCGAASKAFLNWRKDSETHGLQVVYDANVLKFEGNGSFQRLATSLFVLNRDASPFVRFVFPHHEPTAANVVTGPNELAFDELLGLREDSERLRVWMNEFGAVPSGESDRERRCLGITRLLVNYAVLYYSCGLCRYRPAKWRKILDGRRGVEIVQVEAAYEAAEGIADGMINFLRCPAAPKLAECVAV